MSATKIAITTLQCEECNNPINIGDECVEWLVPLANDCCLLHPSCYAALLAGIDAWITAEETAYADHVKDTAKQP